MNGSMAGDRKMPLKKNKGTDTVKKNYEKCSTLLISKSKKFNENIFFFWSVPIRMASKRIMLSIDEDKSNLILLVYK